LVLAPALLGKQVAVRKDQGEKSVTEWEQVVSVESIGAIQVQHITVGDKCFWAGEQSGAYILHHNLKDPGGGDEPDPGDDDWMMAQLPAKSSPDAAKATVKLNAPLPVSQEAAHAGTHAGTADAETPHHGAVAVTLVGVHETQVHHGMPM
jgi:hypothetical protein